MVQLGYGIWYSCVGDPSLRLMHHEMYNNISEVHIGNALARLLPNGKTVITSRQKYAFGLCVMLT